MESPGLGLADPYVDCEPAILKCLRKARNGQYLVEHIPREEHGSNRRELFYLFRAVY
jgi:hypothetical protein